MFKKLFSLLFVFAFLQISSVFSASYDVQCEPRLQKYLAAIQKLPEGRELITKVQKEGPIRIAATDYSLAQQFGAFWDPDLRIIYLNPTPNRQEGSIIGSLLFELHNALGNSKINQLDELAARRQIQKDKYVESMEYLEYQNSLQASAIAEKGIQLGIFPPGAHLPTYSCFEEHYHYQKIGGHSAWFARNYDEMAM